MIRILPLILENQRIRREADEGVTPAKDLFQRFVSKFFPEGTVNIEKVHDFSGKRDVGITAKTSLDNSHRRATASRARELGLQGTWQDPESKDYSKYYTPSGKSRVKRTRISIHRPLSGKYFFVFEDNSKLELNSHFLEIYLTVKAEQRSSDSTNFAYDFIQNQHSQINQFFKDNGYELRNDTGARSYDYGPKVGWGCCFFPKKTKPVTDIVRETEQWLFHASPAFNDESIRQNGFVPSSKNGASNFSENRVYFVLGSDKEKALEKLVRALKNVATDTLVPGKLPKGRGGLKKDFDLWTIYRIKVSLIPDSVEFYFDPEASNDEFVYTPHPVPYSCVRGTAKLNLKGKQALSSL